MYRRFYRVNGSKPQSNKPKKAVSIQMFPAALVWAAACAAQRINGEYLKADLNTYDANQNLVSSRQANKVVMRALLLGQEKPMVSGITDADRQQGEAARQYWQGKMLEVLQNQANDFTRGAIELANREEFAANDWLGLATVAFLPEGYKRGQVRDDRRYAKQDAQLSSQHFGQVGDKVTGNLEVIESRYSVNWNTYYVTARYGTNVVLFSYRSNLEAGHKAQFAGTIKRHRDDNVTQLNRVRLK